MVYNIGDRVKFLNEKGGGVVSKIISPQLVNVTTLDGFDIPYSTRELILIPSEESIIGKMFNADVEETKNIKVEIIEEENSGSGYSEKLNLLPSQKTLDKQSLYLAFIPREQGWLISGGLDVYLVNMTEYHLSFSLFHFQEREFILGFSGEAKPFSRHYLVEIDRDELTNWEKMVGQFMLKTKKSTKIYSPVDIEINIRGSKFYAENSYQKVDFIREKSVLYRIFDLKNLPLMHSIVYTEEKKDVEIISTKVKTHEKNKEIIKFKTGEGQAVVDMHIWELVSDHSHLTEHEMLLTQLDYFKKCLDSAIENHYHKVVFIHGVGTGRLKEEIRDILDEKLIPHKPASMKEYGVGATEVNIPVNLGR